MMPLFSPVSPPGVLLLRKWDGYYNYSSHQVRIIKHKILLLNIKLRKTHFYPLLAQGVETGSQSHKELPLQHETTRHQVSGLCNNSI